MGICADELLDFVIRPVLIHLGDDTQDSEMQLLLTAACESDMGHHLNQNGGLGIFQITPEAHQALWDEYLAFQPELASDIRGLASQHEFLAHPHFELATNLSYATAIAWAMYQRSQIHWPTNIQDMAALSQTTFHHSDEAKAVFMQQYRALTLAKTAVA